MLLTLALFLHVQKILDMILPSSSFMWEGREEDMAESGCSSVVAACWTRGMLNTTTQRSEPVITGDLFCT